MLFQSVHFVVFFVFTLVAFHALVRRWEARKLLLLGASWLFYATWSPRFLLLLIATTAIDFELARRIWSARHAPPPGEPSHPARARALLVASLALNVGVLAFFKYGRFLYASAADLAALPPTPSWLAIAAPLGISFYTFHSISYVVDTWRGVREPSECFADFALYVAFFPQLIAGPITRWGYFGPQLSAPRRLRFRAIEAALLLLAVGFVKKVVFADSLGGFVDAVYAAPDRASRLDAWLAVYGYAFQIYFDFSGYTDVAMGLAGLLGFRLPENFRHPYVALNPAELWRRWHISLSTWLRDYLFLPIARALLRRTRRPAFTAVVATLATMLLAGLWHGAAWTFVLWGGVQGIWLVLHRLVTWRQGPRPMFPAWADAGEPRGAARPPITPAWIRRLATFHVFALSLVLFRAGALEVAAGVARALFASRPQLQPLPVTAILVIAIGALTHTLSLRIDLARLWSHAPRVLRGAAYGATAVAVWLCSAQSTRFIYFEF
ncbi:MAG TPA: MBOAT family O-acyltransferase [Candidatus Binatia bacterium]|nr:MBOAT family O-acyltransferase [Candidatus Binatia bacterium]